MEHRRTATCQPHHSMFDVVAIPMSRRTTPEASRPSSAGTTRSSHGLTDTDLSKESPNPIARRAFDRPPGFGKMTMANSVGKGAGPMSSRPKVRPPGDVVLRVRCQHSEHLCHGPRCCAVRLSDELDSTVDAGGTNQRLRCV